MKKLSLLFFVITFISFSSCNKTEEPAEIVNTISSGSYTEEPADTLSTLSSLSETDDPKNYDQDENCDTEPITTNCCDVDGRILVNAGKSYTYTYKTHRKLALKPGNWAVLTGDIKIVNGQGTDTATFSFGEKFTTGKIQCTGFTGAYEDQCQSSIDISKL